jgi:uncharacterized protein (DUF849 family)
MTLIKACLNGNRPKLVHEGVPVTPEELAEDARRVVAAGAGALHVHPRDSDGRETLDSAACGRALETIRESVPEIPVGISTAAWIEPCTEQRLDAVASWTVLPDFASVNVFEEGAEELCNALAARHIGIEAGIWRLEDAETFVDGNLAPLCLRVLIEAQEAESATAVAAAVQMDALLDGAHIRVPRVWHGEGISTWAVIAAALERGRDIRVGLEDTLVLPDGTPAASNAELVATAFGLVAHGHRGTPIAWRGRRRDEEEN